MVYDVAESSYKLIILSLHIKILRMDGWVDYGFFALSFWLYSSLWRRKFTKKTITQNVKYEHCTKVDAHTLLGGFISDIDARNFVGQPTCSPYCRVIGNTWHFKLFKSFQRAVKELSCSLTYNTIQSSSKLDQQQCNLFDIDSTFTDVKPAGYYLFIFDVPIDWNTREVRIIFPTVPECFNVWINGNFCGISQNYAVSSEFRIDSFVKFGHSNRLEVIVSPTKSATHIAGECSSVFGDAIDSIYLLSLPRHVNISNFRYLTRHLSCALLNLGGCCSWIAENTDRSSHHDSWSVSVDVRLAWDLLDSLRVYFAIVVFSASKCSLIGGLRVGWDLSAVELHKHLI